jgi:hypothetical protein
MNHDESILQADIVQALSLHRIYCLMIPNDAAGKISKARAGRLAAMGLRAGASDILVILPGRVIFLEVKTPTGRQSPAQKVFQEIVESLGHEYRLVRSVDEALAAVKK